LKQTGWEIYTLQNTYDWDKALWEKKFKFLETQKDNSERELVDIQLRFRKLVQQAQEKKP
jgi:hypothetical protein